MKRDLEQGLEKKSSQDRAGKDSGRNPPAGRKQNRDRDKRRGSKKPTVTEKR
jgi:hypothetical protein